MTDRVDHRVRDDRSPLDPAVLAGAESFARSWATAVIRSSYVPMTRAEVAQHLQDLTEMLVEALYASPFRTAPGYEIGSRLVDAHFTGTDTLGRTVQEEIRRARVEIAKRLLVTTGASIAEVAKQSGFTNAALLSIAFQRELGMPPSAYRRRSRAASGGTAG